jgi:hypothetical protein
MVEDWRAFAAKSRTQWQNERSHMVAERARALEIMDQERELWEEERKMLCAQIAELKAEVKKLRDSQVKVSPPGLSRAASYGHAPYGPFSIASAGSNAMSASGSVEGGPTQPVLQESGRDSDGTPVWAPLSAEPSRSFNQSQLREGRVGDVAAPGVSPITVTLKELTPSDFLQSPNLGSTNDLPPISETPIETIDIKDIQPSLDGIHIKTSAIAPSFIATIMSPKGSNSPAKLSPNVRPPNRDVSSIGVTKSASRDSSLDRQKGDKVDAQTVMKAPENQRLTMNAGHTPKPSISKLGDIFKSGSLTPKSGAYAEAPSDQPVIATYDGEAGSILDEDPELRGQLGLKNDAMQDEPFLSALIGKLEDVVRSSRSTSPSCETERTSIDSIENTEVVADEPRLKIKRSTNFGKPFGET